jgi:hypothetical protein
MQTASKKNENGALPHGRASAPKKKTVRNETLKAINVTWRKIAFDLEAEELRNARLAFGTEALGLRKPLKSFSRLSPPQLGRILDAMREIERAPRLPMERPHLVGGTQASVPALNAGKDAGEPPAGMRALPGALPKIHHLATKGQVDAIGKLIRYLGWSAIGTQAFIAKRYNRESERMITPAQANSLTMILLNIAAAKSIKERVGGDVKVSRRDIALRIPRLKRELGIDQKPAADFTDYPEGEFNG